MKTSNRILFITALAIAGLLLAAVVGSRIFLTEYTVSAAGEELNNLSFGTRNEEVRDFNNIEVSGNWDITISQSSTFTVFVHAPEGVENPYEISKKGDTLFVKQRPNLNTSRKFTIAITMPEIYELKSSGGLKLSLTGFKAEELVLNLTGGSWVSGSSCEFKNFRLTSAGAINLEFEDIETVNADVQLSGAGNLLFNMDGGTLTGNAAGAVNIEYLGNARQVIKATGLSNISRRD